MNSKYSLLGALAASIFIQSCTKELTDPIIPNQEELITTVYYTLISIDNSDTATFSFSDLDGPGGNAPIIINDTLKPNLVYNGSIILLNEQVTPAEDITIEVEDEGDAHQFFYTNDLMSKPEIKYTDADINGNPIGISTSFETFSQDNGSLTITLRHTPDKFAAGVFDGDITNAGGETDIEITFDVEIL